MSQPTIERARQLLNYDPETGLFTWRVNQFPAVMGSVAGRLTNKGYRQLYIDGGQCSARRLAWALSHGAWPSSHVETLSGDPDDNRLANLVQRESLKKGRDITAEQLRARLHYDPSTGVFTWHEHASVRRLGKVADSTSHGYVLIGLGGVVHRAQRLAFLYMTGEWPTGVVDHIDGNPSNNRWDNLRDVSTQVNVQNQRASHRGSTSRHLGVYWRKDRKKWQATIVLDKCPRHLGLFDDEDAAGAAYLDAKRQFHAGCTI